MYEKNVTSDSTQMKYVNSYDSSGQHSQWPNHRAKWCAGNFIIFDSFLYLKMSPKESRFNTEERIEKAAQQAKK